MIDKVMVLVGGPCDGRRVKIDGRPKVYYVPRVNRLDFSITPRDPVEESCIKEIYEEYVRIENRVYAHSSVSHLDVVDLLVSGYRNEIGQ